MLQPYFMQKIFPHPIIGHFSVKPKADHPQLEPFQNIYARTQFHSKNNPV